MRPEITAKWAREKATAVLGEKVKEQINKCLDAIANAVKKNEMYVNVYIYAEHLTIQELNKRGFKTEKISAVDQRDSDYLQITW